MKYHDEDEIREGRRDRGDMTGVILSVRGKHMVCAERATFAMALPTSKPLDLSVAQKANAAHTNGWRVLLYGDATLSWHSLNGHPVVRYTKLDESSLSVLFWAKGKQIEEMTIHGSVRLDPCIQDQPKPVVKVKKAEEQLCLMF